MEKDELKPSEILSKKKTCNLKHVKVNFLQYGFPADSQGLDLVDSLAVPKYQSYEL